MRPHLLLPLLLGLLTAGSTAAQPGLRATFYRGQDFSGTPLLTRTDPTIDFNWDYDAPAPGLPQENYCVRWIGALRAPVTGTYIFRITTDDGMRVWLGSKQLFDEWRPQVPSNFSTRVELTAGEYYPLRVEYYQLGYQGQARLTWEPPNADRAQARNLFGLLTPEPETIPPQVLFARAPAPPPVPPVAPVVPSVATPTTPRPVAPARVPTAPQITPRPPVRPAASPTPAPTSPPRAVPPRPITPPAVPAVPADFGRLVKGTTLEVKNLFFEQSRAVLLPASAPVITELATALTQNPQVALEIAGHTDNVGDPAANQLLSEQRAQRIRALLIERGIDSVRLTAVGYGGTRPVTNSQLPLQRARNRRVAVTVK